MTLMDSWIGVDAEPSRPRGCLASFLLRSPWPGFVLLLLLLLFLFRHLLLLAFFLVFLATLVSHACSFSAIMTRDAE
jgi:hypothetical protein